MTLPPLYKYLDVQGAKLTLGNQTFRHAKPSDFNDLEDLTIPSIFPEHLDLALTKIKNSYVDILLQHLEDSPTCPSPQKEQIEYLLKLFRTTPGAADFMRAEIRKNNSIFDHDKLSKSNQAFLADLNLFMQNFRVLCVSTHLHSETMWCGYAENHKGIVLRIESNIAKDSKFQLFRPVIYRENRPSLCENALDFIEQSQFGDQLANKTAMLERIIYSKTSNWEHEGEYRLVVPVMPGEQPWNTRPYHSEEITEMYLGLEMQDSDMNEIVGLAREVNRDICVFRMMRSMDGELLFEPFQ